MCYPSPDHSLLDMILDLHFVHRSVLFSGVALLAWAIASSAADLRSESEALLARARELSDIRALGRPGFHLRGVLRLVDVPNGPVEGTYEESRDPKGHWRRTIEVPDFKYSMVETGDGRRIWHVGTQPYPPYFEFRLRQLLSMSRGPLIPRGEAVTNISTRTIQGRRVNCILSKRKNIKREMCFDASTGVLVREQERVGDNKWTFGYFNYAPFGTKTIPRLVRQLEQNKTFVELEVVELNTATEPKPELFARPAKAVEWPACDDPAPPVALEMPKPRMPSAARRRHLRGKVVIYIVVGVDGRAYNATPVQADALSLAKATLDAVSLHWRFRPAMCNGVPRPTSMFVETSFMSF